MKIHGFDALPTREVCAAARCYRIPLLVDVVRRVGVVEILAEQCPDVNFLIPHLGKFADDWMTHLAVIHQLCRFPNVYADTSGVRYWEILRRVVYRDGAHKLLFGSDEPLLNPAVELYKIKLLQLSQQEEQLVLGTTMARLLNLPVTESAIWSFAPHEASQRLM